MALTSTEEALVRQLLDQQAAILSLAGNEATITSKLGATKVTLSDLVSASAVADADLFLMRQGTTDKSVTGAIVKALASQPDASTTVKGIVELATDAETQTGTDAVRAVTPASLHSRAASETLTGLIELATAAEAIAGTDALRAITPARLRSGLNASGNAPIYACRAWVNWNGSNVPSIRGSGNVSSITDNGVGDYTINFATAMPDTGYALAGHVTSDDLTAPHQWGILTSRSSNEFLAGSVRVTTATSYNATTYDTTLAAVAIFR